MSLLNGQVTGGGVTSVNGDAGPAVVLNAADVGADASGAAAAAQAAAQAYADGLVVGLWDDRGAFDASGGAYPSTGGSGTAGAILKGDIWTISVAGTLPTGQVVEIGDVVRALINTPGNTQANWAITQNNIGYVAENAANKNSVNGYVGLSSWSIVFRNLANSFTSLLQNANTAARTYIFQDRDGIIADDTDLALKAPLASPALTGTPTAPTAAAGTNTAQLATTAFVHNEPTITRAIAKLNIAVGHTGDTLNTVKFTQLIPAGTFEANDIFFVFAKWRATSSGNGKTLRMYFNTTPDLTGSPVLVATHTIGTGVTTTGFGREITFLNALNSQKVQNAATSSNNEYAVVNAAMTALAVDFSVDQYIIFALQLVSGAETVAIETITSHIER